MSSSFTTCQRHLLPGKADFAKILTMSIIVSPAPIIKPNCGRNPSILAFLHFVQINYVNLCDYVNLLTDKEKADSFWAIFSHTAHIYKGKKACYNTRCAVMARRSARLKTAPLEAAHGRKL
jgi:hypothetical protein